MTTETTQRDLPKPEFTDAEAGAREFPDSNARRYNYYTPQKRKQSHYEDVTVEVQPDPRHYLSQGWLYGFSDGRGGYPLEWTALKAWGSDRPEPERFPGSGGRGYDWPALGWHEFRDPNEEWELTLYRYNANVVRQINANIETARETKAFEQWNRNWVTFVERNIGAWMHVEHGLGLYLFANANRRAPTNMHNNAISVNSMHRIRTAQDLALYNLTLSEEIDGFDGAAHIETWNSDPAWSPDGKRIAYSNSTLGRFRIVDAESGTEIVLAKNIWGSGPFWFHPEGRRILGRFNTTGASVLISAPNDRAAFAIASLTAPVPPRGMPHARRTPSISPM